MRKIVSSQGSESFLKGGKKSSLLIHGSFSDDLSYRDIDIGVYVDEKEVSQNDAIEYGLRISAQGEMETGITPLDLKVINYAPVGFRYYATKGILLTLLPIQTFIQSCIKQESIWCRS